jgi:hypothetical protein
LAKRINRTHAAVRSKLLALVDDPNTDTTTKANAVAGLAALEVATIKLRTLREREAAREKRTKVKQAKEQNFGV